LRLKIHIFSAFYRLLLRDSVKNVMPRLAMQIVCPNCATAYEIPDAVFGGRARKLRCENCGTQWRAGPPGGEAGPEEAGQTVDNSLPPPPETRRVFGKPVDAAAEAEFQEAMDREAMERAAVARAA
jgi:predicted Zn finger-like uncharacterized protein